jgi:hypothetical protein
MNTILKRTLIALAIIITIILLSYGAVKLYNYVIQDATQKIKKGVAEGVGEGVGGANPLSWPGKLFGGK